MRRDGQTERLQGHPPSKTGDIAHAPTTRVLGAKPSQDAAGGGQPQMFELRIRASSYANGMQAYDLKAVNCPPGVSSRIPIEP